MRQYIIDGDFAMRIGFVIRFLRICEDVSVGVCVCKVVQKVS